MGNQCGCLSGGGVFAALVKHPAPTSFQARVNHIGGCGDSWAGLAGIGATFARCRRVWNAGPTNFSQIPILLID